MTKQTEDERVDMLLGQLVDAENMLAYAASQYLALHSKLLYSEELGLDPDRHATLRGDLEDAIALMSDALVNYDEIDEKLNDEPFVCEDCKEKEEVENNVRHLHAVRPEDKDN